jgi:putative ABC transport system substrate-binding protein
MRDFIRRRELIALLGGAAAASSVSWPFSARAQQPAMPVVGILFATSQAERPEITIAIRKGLAEIGYIEGQNVAFEYRSAEAQDDRLPALAAELVRRRVSHSVGRRRSELGT